MDQEGFGRRNHCLNPNTITEFVGQGEVKKTKTANKITGIQAKIREGPNPHRSVGCYCYANLLGLVK
jgi:hypothetical protein